MTPRVVIVGGGLAGLTAAHRLLARNVDVTLVDKGHRVGGRMCTRAVGLPDGRTATFDLGPPILYNRRLYEDRGEPAYRATRLDNELSSKELFTRRPVGRIGAEGERASAEIVGLTSDGGMRELPFRLLSRHHEQLDFRDHTTVERLQRTDEGWKVHIRSLRDDSTDWVHANAVILTPPVPQTLQLLADSSVTLPDDLRDALRSVMYSQCLAVYGVFTGGDPLPPGGVWLGDGRFEWITDNAQKEVSGVPWSVTALATPGWSELHWSEKDERILELLVPRLKAWVGDPIGTACVWLQRWQYAKPLTPIRPPCMLVRDLGMVFAGDGFASSSPDPVDAAIASGEAAAGRASALLTALVRTNDRYTIARPKHVTLEIAVCTPAEAALAAINGADRLELSVGLEVGGLTPSLGLFRQVRGVVGNKPIYVLIRPRSGGFAYSPREFEAMQADAEMLLGAGAAGIVFGIFTPEGGIDHYRCRSLVETAGGKAVFHRAFDFLPDPLAALDELIDLGFERVLTSGGASTAEAGTTHLAALVQHAGWQIEVLPAGKILPHNVADLVRATCCDQVHAAVREKAIDPALARNPRLAPGLGGTTETSGYLVSRLRQALDRLAEARSE